MPETYEPSHLETAIERFQGFFGELRTIFVERDSVLTQFALALLGRQHVLMTGPPGTAKSQMAALTLGRIIDESTGGPSLFARQFTENTVQTDLVGPINFKTLMESGRTEHFTDEGILGSVHAFLDEVFDGRDMLLRSTLNILHEREVKQGGQIATGRIECAFMTSNRYIAEVLDSSRETLLAFIDRISFISFIPRGFADADSLKAVVRQHGGGFGQHRPTAYLSVQDLDVLQAATDLTYVPEEICDAVADLVSRLDADLAEARRYDPKFQPTRYLSTRTTVQATRVLRAAALFDKIFNRPSRPLQVEHADLKWLRYFLLLGGMPASAIAKRISSETDPRERRQLDIMATEAEVFDRCFAGIKPVKTKPSPKQLDLDRLTALASKARDSGDSGALTDAVTALLTATESGAADATSAADLLIDTVGTLSGRALRGGLTPELGGEDPTAHLRSQLTEFADTLERTPGYGRPLAQWLRGRLLDVLDDALRLAPSPGTETVALLSSSPTAEALAEQIDARLRAASVLFGLRRRLRPDGGPGESSTQGGPREVALGKLEDELALLWDAQFRLAAKNVLHRSPTTPMGQVLRSLSPVLERLKADADRFAALGRDSELVRRVTQPRLEPLVARAFEKLDSSDRTALVEQVESVIAELAGAALGDAIPPEHFVAWSVPALARGERDLRAPDPVQDRASYEARRAREHSLSVTDALVRIAIASLPPKHRSPEEPKRAAETVWETLRSLGEEDRKLIVQLDLDRVRRGVDGLESWWDALSGADPEAPPGVPRSVAVLERIAESGYLRAVQGGAEPLRLVAEISHLSEVFPASVKEGAALRTRLERLDAESTQVMVELLQKRSDRAWSETLSSESLK